MVARRLGISCLCGKASPHVTVRGGDDLQQGSLDGLVAYSPVPHSTSYFCAVCGCHVFAYLTDATTLHGRDKHEVRDMWAVATGTVVRTVAAQGSKLVPSSDEPVSVRDWVHDRTSETVDGGISIWIHNTSEGPSGTQSWPRAAIVNRDMTLPASCHCGTVRFHITRPDASSVLPKSPFPDLMLPYCHSDASVIENPSDVKWWLRSDNRYLAGTCACRSCRLASGFEIQTWAFVPRSNIFIHPRASQSGEAEGPQRLDFETIPPAVLKSFESSPGVAREFCPRCGATVFWHNKERPDLIDVSVGLFEAPDGARAESWLEWWAARVSFAEEAGLQTSGNGSASQRATQLIRSLETGLRLCNHGQAKVV